MKCRVAIVQRDIAWSDVEGNLRALEQELLGVNADVVVLSEMFQTGFVTEPQCVVDGGATLEWMKRMATQLDAAIVGSVAVCRWILSRLCRTCQECRLQYAQGD